MPNVSQNQTILGQSIVLHGEMSGKEDLLIEGQLEGTINLPEHSVTVGSHGEVKAEVHARQVIVLGALTGNITATEKVEIRKTGQVVGDLAAAAVAIEDGAYFKGSIDILREQSHGAPRSASISDPLKANV
jgi:cytoskeletal protein CcmA (bactofilin family)